MKRLQIKLSNGIELEFDPEEPKELFEIVIADIFIPKYQKSDDFNLAVNIGLEEMNRLITNYNLKPDLKLGILNALEAHLQTDLADLAGVAKIEILFMNMDDYVEDIKRLLTSGLDKQEIRNNMAKLISPLTVFEIGELFIYLGKEAFLK